MSIQTQLLGAAVFKKGDKVVPVNLRSDGPKDPEGTVLTIRALSILSLVERMYEFENTDSLYFEYRLKLLSDLTLFERVMYNIDKE